MHAIWEDDMHKILNYINLPMLWKIENVSLRIFDIVRDNFDILFLSWILENSISEKNQFSSHHWQQIWSYIWAQNEIKYHLFCQWKTQTYPGVCLGIFMTFCKTAVVHKFAKF